MKVVSMASLKKKRKAAKSSNQMLSSSDFQGLNSYWVLSNTVRKKKKQSPL